MLRTLAFTALAAACATPALAVTVRDCDGRTEAAYNIVEPWAENSRTYYQGKVRVAWLDTGGEPACCSAHLLILFYRDDDVEGFTCRLVSADGEAGFAGIDFKSLRGSYDPRRGLLLTFGYSRFTDGYGEGAGKGVAKVRINVSTGAVTAE